MVQTRLETEVVVVDNGSSDGSAEGARAAGARVVNEGKRGYGNALRSGIQAAKGSVIVMADADCSYDLGKLPLILRPLVDGKADLVIGSRLETAARSTMPLLHRYAGTPLLSYLLRRAGAGLRVRDSQSGFRAFRKSVASRLALQSGGMEFASEMLIRAGQEGLRVLEVPTGYRRRVGESKLNTLGDGTRHLNLILLLAPQIVLLVPGVLLFCVGLLFTALTVINPTGIAIGSLRWQPIFFSSIALTLGMQSALVGMVLANRSLVGDREHDRFRFVRTRTFTSTCMGAGVEALVLGLLIDTLLLLHPISGADVFARGLQFASAAQSLLLLGGTLLSFGFVVRCLNWRQP
jgi:glycosyltransferase involved in cell wall biosynthesis